jgi:hypothetical protein
LASFVDNVLLMWLSSDPLPPSCSGTPSLCHVSICSPGAQRGSCTCGVWRIRESTEAWRKPRWPHGSFTRTQTALLGSSYSLWPMINGNESGFHSGASQFKSWTEGRRKPPVRLAVTEAIEHWQLDSSITWGYRLSQWGTFGGLGAREQTCFCFTDSHQWPMIQFIASIRRWYNRTLWGCRNNAVWNALLWFHTKTHFLKLYWLMFYRLHAYWHWLF